MRALLTLAVLAVALPAAAQVKGPESVSLKVGELSDPIDLSADVDEFKYTLLGTRLKGFREYTTDPKVLRLVVIGYAEETAWVVVSAAKGGKLQELTKVKVTVTGATPPGPIDPPKPPPTDPLVLKFSNAFLAAGFTSARVKALAAGLEDCRALAATATGGADFFAKALPALQRAMATAGGDGKIPPAVAAVLSSETEAVLGKDTAAPWNAAAAGDLYKRLAAAVRAAGGSQ